MGPTAPELLPPTQTDLPCDIEGKTTKGWARKGREKERVMPWRGSGLHCGMACFAATLVLAADKQGRDRMLENQLLLGIGFQDDGIFIKRTNVAGEFGSVQQLYSDVLSGRQGHVEKRFLDIDHRHAGAKD